MIEIPDIILNFVILPIMSAQLFIVLSVYFTFIGRHVLHRVRLFNCFIATYVIYLLGHSLQMFAETNLAYSTLYFRMALFLTIGLPSLTLFLFAQCGYRLQRSWSIAPYIIGGIMSLLYVMGSDSRHAQLIFGSAFIQPLPFSLLGAIHIDAEMFALLALSLIPVGYLLYLELISEKRKTCLAFLIGALIITMLYIVGLYHQTYWLYYIGSMLTALYWMRSVYVDVKATKSEAQELKEELRMFIQKEDGDLDSVLNKLLSTIENESKGSLQRYKLKIREILDELTDSTIEAGGDAEDLLERNLNNMAVIQRSDDTDAIRRIVAKETFDLTNMISELPVKRSEKIILQTKAFIEQNFQQNIEVTELASEVNVSQSYLMRCFKKETGKTIKQYLTQCRIEKAKTLLHSMSVSDTAFAVGYNDSNYFGNVFKREVGLGPQQYKKENMAK